MNVAALLFLIALSPISDHREFLRQAVASLRMETAQAAAHYMDSNLSLRWYAHKVLRDYGRMESVLCDVGRAYGLALKGGDSAAAPRPFFANDALWLATAIQSQRKAIARFQQEEGSTRDARIRHRIAAILRVLRADLRLSQRISLRLLQRAVT